MDDAPIDRHRSSAVRRAVGIHGPDTEEEYDAPLPVIAFQMSVALIPLAVAAGAAVGAAFTSGFVFWACAVLVALLVWPSLIGLSGALWLLTAPRTVVLIYKDRLLVQTGSAFESVPWEDIETVFVRTQAGKPENVAQYEPGNPFRLFVQTEFPLAKFWAEWTEVRTRHGQVIRLYSSIWDYENMSRTIQCEVSVRACPVVIAEYKAGRPVSFGPIAATPDWLRVGNFSLAWSEHGATWVQGGLVNTVEASGGQIGPPIATEHVPNLAVACYLILEIRSGAFQPKPSGDDGEG